MILPDINLLLYTQNIRAPEHPRARVWWEKQLNSDVEIALAWVTVLGFVRIATSRSFPHPLTVSAATKIVSDWFARPNVSSASPGPRHWEILSKLIDDHNLVGNSQTDAHLAAIAIESDFELHSNDDGFKRFKDLKWINPF